MKVNYGKKINLHCTLHSGSPRKEALNRISCRYLRAIPSPVSLPIALLLPPCYTEPYRYKAVHFFRDHLLACTQQSTSQSTHHPSINLHAFTNKSTYPNTPLSTHMFNFQHSPKPYTLTEPHKPNHTPPKQAHIQAVFNLLA